MTTTRDEPFSCLGPDKTVSPPAPAFLPAQSIILMVYLRVWNALSKIGDHADLEFTEFSSGPESAGSRGRREQVRNKNGGDLLNGLM
jgi:hypothetical protein